MSSSTKLTVSKIIVHSVFLQTQDSKKIHCFESERLRNKFLVNYLKTWLKDDSKPLLNESFAKRQVKKYLEEDKLADALYDWSTVGDNSYFLSQSCMDLTSIS